MHKTGNLGESGGELNSEDRSVNALQSDSPSDMIRKSEGGVYNVLSCDVAGGA